MTPRSIAQNLLLATLTLAAPLTILAATAGAATVAPPLDHEVVVVFTADDFAHQTPTHVEAVDGPDAAWARMVELADAACSGRTWQVDYFGPGMPTPEVGVEYPADTPGALSAIPSFEGTVDCATPTPVTTTPTDVPTPQADTTIAIDLTTGVTVEAASVENPTGPPAETGVYEATSIAVARTPRTLASTGANSTGMLAGFAAFLLTAGGLVTYRTRRAGQ
jgi:hypothetical protein